MRFCIEGVPSFRSTRVPDSIQLAFAEIFNNGGAVTLDAVSKIPATPSSDSNMDHIAEAFDCAVVADGSEALRSFLEGLLWRLKNPLSVDEKLSIRGE